jgi:diguanylate cyclase (GGDEF)-like protein
MITVNPEPEASIIGLITQAAAITLVAVLSFLLTRSVRRTCLTYWKAAWSSLAIALGSLLFSFWYPQFGILLRPLYLVGEYAFGFLIIAGCRNFVTDFRLKRRNLWLLAPGAAIAIVLELVGGGDFNLIFIPHAAIISYLFFAAFRTVVAAPSEKPRTPGMRVMTIALLLLSVDFLLYVPVFLVSVLKHVQVPIRYLQYTSLYDLVLEVLLGFGMVMKVLEDTVQELESSNLELTRARDKMESLAHTDALTETANRHSLFTLLEQHSQSTSTRFRGCLALIDMDDLKRINDTYGHTAGDAAIRALAKAIRSLIRPDDLLFRWGGDEFLVLLFGVAESGGRKRLEGLTNELGQVSLPGAADPVSLTASIGVASFSSPASLTAAIELADSSMYAMKQFQKSVVRPGA